MAKTTTKKRSGGGRSGPSGLVAWTLWLIVIALLAVIARYAFIAAQPDRRGYTLLGREGSLLPDGKHSVSADAGPIAGSAHRKSTRDYSRSDRAKLDRLVDDASGH